MAIFTKLNIFVTNRQEKKFVNKFWNWKKVPIFAVLNFAIKMKEGIHPKNYRKVVFKDMSNEHMFICQSTVDTKETIQYEDGNEYPLFKLDISYKSHPFFTGQSMFIDTAGRIDKFKKRYQKKAD